MSETRRTIEERFYALLPQIHRIRDLAQGEPLRALLAILEHEFQAVRDDTQGLYDDWFVETCKEWVVPYIGDLLGVELMRAIEAEGFTQRAYVANTLAYRRRKGTAAVLEQLAFDVTGWRTRAVEYFQRLATTQHLQHLHRRALVTASLRNAAQLELVDGPFGHECHTGEVRSITSRRGRFNIPNVGLHVWRLQRYPLERVEARAVHHQAPPHVPAGRYHFDVLGRRGPLFNDPRSETNIVHLAEERDVPAPLRRRALYAELATGKPPADGWFGDPPVLRVFRVDGTVETELLPIQTPAPNPADPPIPAKLHICNLAVEPDIAATDWPRPATAGHVYVDPELGRLSFKAGDEPDAVLVHYSYGFSADLGGGPYDRRTTVPERLDVDVDNNLRVFHHGVSKDESAVGTEHIHTSLAAAIDAWNLAALQAEHDGADIEGVISVMDSRSYGASLTRATGRPILLPASARLRLVAADWPTEIDDPVAGSRKRTAGRLDPSGVRPHLRGNIEVLGLGGGTLEIDGLLIEGSLTVLAGSLASLALRHSTLAVGHGGLLVESSNNSKGTNAALELELTRAIVDGVTLTSSLAALRISDCILATGARLLEIETETEHAASSTPVGSILLALAAADPEVTVAVIAARLATISLYDITWDDIGKPNAAPSSLIGPEVDADIDTSTLLGATALRSLEGSESLFVGRVEVRVVQAGCLRYSYASVDSITPRRFRCQPDLALAAAETAALDAGEIFSLADAAAIAVRVRPLFTSITPGHPAYGQLARAIADELFTGAEDGSEMGAFHMLQQAHRESNLRVALEQYLRFGLDAGIFHAT